MSKVTNEQLEKGVIANLRTGKELNVNPHMNEGFTREDHLAAVSFYKGLTDRSDLTPDMLLKMNKNLNIHNSLADRHFADGGVHRLQKSEVEEDETFEKGPTYEDLESIDDLEKGGGEGSRGGKVIGHTKSGKPIYETQDHPSPKHKTLFRDAVSYTEHDSPHGRQVHVTRKNGQKDIYYPGSSGDKGTADSFQGVLDKIDGKYTPEQIKNFTSKKPTSKVGSNIKIGENKNGKTVHLPGKGEPLEKKHIDAFTNKYHDGKSGGVFNTPTGHGKVGRTKSGQLSVKVSEHHNKELHDALRGVSSKTRSSEMSDGFGLGSRGGGQYASSTTYFIDEDKFHKHHS